MCSQLDSTRLEESNKVGFTNFGVIQLKLWILQVFNELATGPDQIQTGQTGSKPVRPYPNRPKHTGGVAQERAPMAQHGPTVRSECARRRAHRRAAATRRSGLRHPKRGSPEAGQRRAVETKEVWRGCNGNVGHEIENRRT